MTGGEDAMVNISLSHPPYTFTTRVAVVGHPESE
jgi:hypothetical protein